MTNENITLNWYERSSNRKLAKKYYGEEGYLKAIDGSELQCKFELGQFEDGKIILLCDFSIDDIDFQKCCEPYIVHCSSISAKKSFLKSYENLFLPFFAKFTTFNGKTSDKLIILKGTINSISRFDKNSLLDNDSSRVIIEYFMEDLDVTINANENLHYIVFGITNFAFGEDDSYEETLKIFFDGEKYLIIEKKERYGDIMNLLENLGGIYVTCEVSLKFDNEIDIVKSIEIVTDLCNIMSIARGTTVNWIYYKICTEDKKILCWKHVNRVCKNYENVTLVNKKLDTTKLFIEEAYTAFNESNNLLKNNKRIIYAYLDAKAHSDDLNARGIKLVVVIEILTNAFLDLPNARIKRNIIKKKHFDKLKDPIIEAIKGVIEEYVSNERDRDLLYSQIIELNHTPFRDIISELRKSVDLKMEEEDITLFVKCRNKLVHQGTFLSKFATIEDKKRWPVLKDEIFEYLFLSKFVDEILLKLLKYKHKYFYWSEDMNYKGI